MNYKLINVGKGFTWNYFLIPPEKCLLRSKYVKQPGGRGQKLTKKFGHFIPLFNMLQGLMRLPQFSRFIKTENVSDSKTMNNVCDGSNICSHPLTGQGETFLKFVILYDDFELQNPLRSSKIHKLAMFYFTLLNIPPQYRSVEQYIPFGIHKN